MFCTCWRHGSEGSNAVQRRDLSAVLRAAAQGATKDGEHSYAKDLRARARKLENRDGWRRGQQHDWGSEKSRKMLDGNA
jgi:hypothetical protein